MFWKTVGLGIVCGLSLLSSRASAHSDTAMFAPLENTLAFSATDLKSGQHLCVATLQGPPCDYVLRLVPDRDVQGDVATLELTLNRAAETDDPYTDNLLAPGPWHGMQKFTFAASDLAAGPSHTIYGAHRTILLPDRDISVEITILSAAVQQVAEPGSQFPYSIESLKLGLRLSPIGNNAPKATR